ncbi:class I SAM-dependent methyltransferase [Niallia circulans]|uniref:class I SAM-dependent methyltransferase n=1 Tax=Niallia circulans TaxID=1397 RepID=UPI00201D7F27|nr:class I SAM-dependent methyltransferase [Niallia circulans]
MNYDKLLHIGTEEVQVGFHKSYHYHRYEPTPYEHLEQLFREFPLREADHIVDFGCGKGRLNFYIHYVFQSTVKGVEINEDFYHQALHNLERYAKNRKKKKEKIHFYLGRAEDYFVQPEDNYFYFFNPFSLPIFQKLLVISYTHWKKVVARSTLFSISPQMNIDFLWIIMHYSNSKER